jgi:hypothetical protein
MKQKGFAALLIIFILGMVSILIASGLILTGYNESQMARSGASGTTAFYAANSGVEDAIYKLTKNSFVVGMNKFNLDLGNGNNASVSASVATNSATIRSIGTVDQFVSIINAKVSSASVSGEIKYAIQAGEGGIKFDDKVKGNITGNVYSKGNINADKDISIIGSASASGTIESTVHATPSTSHAPNIDLPVFDLSITQSYLNNFSPITGPYTVSNGSIGDVIVKGDLTLSNLVTITGPVWVTGNVDITNSAEISLDPKIISSHISQILVAEKTITINAKKSTFPSGVFLLLISTYAPSVSDLCTDPSIIINANLDSVLYYAPKGCLKVDLPSAVSEFIGSAIGEKIFFNQLQKGLRFDTDLSTAIFGLAKKAGWLITSFSQN